ncbi:UNVERIFIED_ORG: hypothetical protein J2811_005364 [Burkholderia cepacia]|nr:hypothetical protein [Burkholderia cepacia]MDP9597603.1 hypothetical protein [Burkholderia cepacia]MDP9625895.1 hypothetical protein [Burkholderia cepacia]MDP9671980.1 hypothetical protein [Burkholderia cepacia]MDP9719044.1 hypothetical protein [Burkholderia cepacia]
MEHFLPEFAAFVEPLADQPVAVVEHDRPGIRDGHARAARFKRHDIAHAKPHAVIFSDRHRSLSFLYIEYIDIPGGALTGHWNVPQIINQKIIRQLPRAATL